MTDLISDAVDLTPGSTYEVITRTKVEELASDVKDIRGRIDGIPGRRGLLHASCDGQSVQVEGRVREVLCGDMRLHV